MKQNRIERFLEKVSPAGCRVWLGARNSWGYGTFMWDGKKESGTSRQNNINASRAAWLLFKGEIPSGMDVLHTCNNRACVNVEHMYLGTDVENAVDRRNAGTIPKGEKAWNPKLTNAQALEILQAKGTAPASVIAARYPKLTAANVSAIWRGDTWKHLHEKLHPTARISPHD